MKHVILFLIASLLTSLLPLAVNAEQLGVLKVFTSHLGSTQAEMTLVSFGTPKERRVLAYFDTPEFAINGEYNVYHGQCKTTACNKIVYSVIGGASRNFVSNSGHFGDYFELLLPGRNKPLAVYYDKKKSNSTNKNTFYEKYLRSVGRNKIGNYNADAVKKSVNEQLKNIQQMCQSKLTINKNEGIFRQQKLLHLIGMSAYYLKEIAAKCADVDYREELTKITSISILPNNSNSKTSIKLKGSQLFIYLSESIYNPRHEARQWLNNL